MSARCGNTKAYFDKESREALDEVVNFGPEEGVNGGSDFSSRVRQLMKKLQEIDARLERLDEQL